MKKLLIALLAGAMVLATAACGKTPEETPVTPEGETTENGDVTPDTSDTPATDAETTTVGTDLANLFKENAKTAESNEALANLLIADAPFMAGVVPASEGFLSGFDNYEVKGFSEGYMFGPMMGTIPFVGYVFELPADADVEAFKKNLTDNANLRWNICTEAEEMVVESVDNKVFFVMCPKSFDVPEEDTGDDFVDDEFIDEDTVVVGGDEAAEGDAVVETTDATEENLDNEISAEVFDAIDEK